MTIDDCRWTQLPNDFIDQGGIPLIGPTATCVYWCIARRTKGWQKESDYISYSQIHDMTGFSSATISKAIRTLSDNDLIGILVNRGGTASYRLIVQTPTTSNSEVPLFKNCSGTTSNSEDTKETLKETIQKKERSTVDFEAEIKKIQQNEPYIETAQLLLDLCLEEDPNCVVKRKREATVASWADDIRKLVVYDDRDLEVVGDVIVWIKRGKSKQANFWRPVVRSASGLRRNFPTLFPQYFEEYEESKKE